MVIGLQKGKREVLEHLLSSVFSDAKTAGFRDPLRWFLRLARRAERDLKAGNKSVSLETLQAETVKLQGAVVNIQRTLQETPATNFFSKSARALLGQTRAVADLSTELGTVHALLEQMKAALQQHNLPQYKEDLAGLLATLKESKHISKAIARAVKEVDKDAKSDIAEEARLVAGARRRLHGRVLGLALLGAAASFAMGCAASQHGKAAVAGDVEAADWLEEAQAIRATQIKKGGDPYGYAGGAAVLSDGSVAAWAERSSYGVSQSTDDAKARARAECIRRKKPYRDPGFALKGGLNPNAHYDEASGTVYVRVSVSEERGATEYKPARKV